MSKIAKERPRLGRGLSTLISSMATVNEEVAAPAIVEESPASNPASSSPPTPVVKAPWEIPIRLITANPHQPRKDFGEAALAELAESLKTTGLIQPIIVRQVGDAYQLIAGERRLRAAKLAGMETIPAIVREVDGFNQAQMALIENTQREDLNPIDRAAAYRGLLEQLGLTQNELAKRLGEDRSSIANHLRLLDLALPVRDLIASGALSLGHAKVLAGVADPAEQVRLAVLADSKGLSVRGLESEIARVAKPQAAGSKAASPHLDQVEKSISRQLGMRVQVRAGAGKSKGRLVIHYASLDQFDELVSKLGVTLEG
jgi:ParB family chromosome partitioning protein